MNTCIKESFVPSVQTAALERQSVLLFGCLLLATPLAVQAQFTYTVTNQTVTITEYTGTNGVVVIPDTINGLPVTSIGPEAFRDTGLTSITIPNSYQHRRRCVRWMLRPDQYNGGPTQLHV